MEQLNKIIEEGIFVNPQLINELSERDIENAFGALRTAKPEGELPANTVSKILKSIQFALTRKYESSITIWEIFMIINDLAPFHPKEIASYQDSITKAINYNHLSHKGFTDAIYFMGVTWEHLAPEWTEENKKTIINHLIDIIKEEYEEYEEFDAFVADDVLRALKKIGKGNAQAQEIIEWTEKIIDETEDEDDEDEDDDE
ncbi:hypothetical protein [Chryseobacterium koreense]|uniref:hypothetical protein n=1 Tax=Chryseobacterium koreense TaxID=232216 RepID=UPI0026F08A33|nr:hypothetical protein [Chryseobacterium koreense]